MGSTSAFTGVPIANKIAISMNGKGANSCQELARQCLWSRASYNARCPHTSLDRRPPDEAYFNPSPMAVAA
jgi:hypothetical protein